MGWLKIGELKADKGRKTQRYVLLEKCPKILKDHRRAECPVVCLHWLAQKRTFWRTEQQEQVPWSRTKYGIWDVWSSWSIWLWWTWISSPDFKAELGPTCKTMSMWPQAARPGGIFPLPWEAEFSHLLIAMWPFKEKTIRDAEPWPWRGRREGENVLPGGKRAEWETSKRVIGKYYCFVPCAGSALVSLQVAHLNHSLTLADLIESPLKKKLSLCY